MTTFWKILKKYPCAATITVLAFLTIMTRVQGNIATLLERTLVNFVSGIAIISISLYVILYLTGSLNPGDKVIINFKKHAAKLLRGSAGNH